MSLDSIQSYTQFRFIKIMSETFPWITIDIFLKKKITLFGNYC